MKSISRKDYLDTDPYRDKQKETEDRIAERDFRDDMEIEDRWVYGDERACGCDS